MPNRIIKESICTSDTIDKMTWFEECFFHRLWVNCDDYGRMDARPAILKAKLFPLKERMSIKDVEGALGRLADIGCVRLYECDSKPYLYLPTWEVHQNIRAKKSKFPAPSDVNTSEIICMQMQADDGKCSRNPIQSVSESVSESNSVETRAKRFVPPTLEEVAAYVRERQSKVDPQGFIDFYASKGWMVGKAQMKDWKAACRNAEDWERWNKPTPRSQRFFPAFTQDPKDDLDLIEKLLGKEGGQ